MRRLVKVIAILTVALVGGGGFALMLAIAVIAWSPPADTVIRQNDSRLVAGLGFESIANLHSSPDANGQLFAVIQTKAGFPFFCVRTNSQFAARLHPARPVIDRDPSERAYWRLEWSGLFVNSLLFGVIAILPWSMRAGDKSRRITASIAFGLWLSIVLAWVCHAFHRGLELDYHTTNPEEFSVRVHPVTWPKSAWQWFEGSEDRAFGFRYWSYHFADIAGGAGRAGMQSYTTLVHEQEQRLSLGWPLACLETNRVYRGSRLSVATAFAIPVTWVGLIADWAFWFAIAILVWYIPAWIKRVYRYRHAQCTFCGYPRGESKVCTECGNAVRSRLV